MRKKMVIVRKVFSLRGSTIRYSEFYRIMERSKENDNRVRGGGGLCLYLAARAEPNT